MPVILILTPFWRRPDITRIWAEWIKLTTGYNIRVLAVLSPEDEFFEENRAILSDFDRVLYKNKPLSEKLNAGINYALTLKWDYLMNLGSDDLLHPLIWNLYEPYIKSEEPFFGLKRVYFFDMEKKRLGQAKEYFWGAGRMIHRSVIEKIGCLYTPGRERGLDCDSKDRIVSKYHYLALDTEDFPYVVDLKTWDSLNDYDFNLKLMDQSDTKILNKHYPKFITNQIL